MGTDWLDEQERTRMRKYRSAQDGKSFSISRAALRDILGRYTKQKPEKIVFDYNRFGKPFISSNKELTFNLSHSNKLCVIGVCANREIGVDIEGHCQVWQDTHLQQTLFTCSEQKEFDKLPVTLKAQAFLTVWTTKESFLKELGLGFQIGLNIIETNFRSSRPQRITRVRNADQQHYHWAYQIPVPRPYVATLVLDHQVNLNFLNWQNSEGTSFSAR